MVFVLFRLYLCSTSTGRVWMDGDHENEPKRRQTRRLNWALGMFVFFRVLYILTNDFLFYLGCIYVLQAREWFGSTAITKMGPNDARHVIWALGTMFFILKFFRAILYILTNQFLFYLVCFSVLQDGKGSDGRRSQKRAQTTPDTSFGP